MDQGVDSRSRRERYPALCVSARGGSAARRTQPRGTAGYPRLGGRRQPARSGPGRSRRGAAVKLYLSTTTDGVRTTGALLVGQETFHSMELPWKENAKDISCIPGGTYSLIPYESPRHGSTWR